MPAIAPKAPPKNPNPQQHRLFNAPFVLFRLPLVRTVKYERCDAHYKKKADIAQKI